MPSIYKYCIDIYIGEYISIYYILEGRGYLKSKQPEKSSGRNHKFNTNKLQALRNPCPLLIFSRNV